MKKLLILFLLLLVGCGLNKVDLELAKKVKKPLAKTIVNESAENKEIPTEVLLEVPFVMQAPFANWSEHNESCEEAGILLAHYFYTKENLTKAQADWEIKDMVKYQIDNLGDEHDIYAEEIKWLADGYYGGKARIINGTKENIMAELAAGNPVIALTTAAYLKPEKNDYPEMGYHIVLIVGYDSIGFITHDVGTVTGEDTYYSFGTIDQATVDYGHDMVVLK